MSDTSVLSSSLPREDRVHRVVDLFSRLVTVARWRFGRLRGDALDTFACGPAPEAPGERHAFAREIRAQRRRDIPRMTFSASAKERAYPYTVGLMFADSQADVTMLVLARTESGGPFSVHELGLLSLALESGQELLSAPPRERAAADGALKRREMPMLFVLDSGYRIVMGPRLQLDRSSGIAMPEQTDAGRLPAVIEVCVRELVEGGSEAVGTPLPFLAVRTQLLAGGGASYVAVTLERVRERNVLGRASMHYTITQREREVLAHVLDGRRVEQIADLLSIAPSTVNDHIKSLIARTRSTNRSQMLARILGWDRE